MRVFELIEILQQHANEMGGDNGLDMIEIWHNGSDAKLIITDCKDKNKQTVVAEG